MTQSLTVRKPTQDDLQPIKQLFDRHKAELGFVLRPSLIKAIDMGEMFVASANSQLVGVVHYHHRRDHQTTLYHIAVESSARGNGIGCELVHALRAECISRGMDTISLKCPLELSANGFYEHIGFHRVLTETGKRRPLQIWRMFLESLG